MNKEFQDAILLVQELLTRSGNPVATLARAAAFSANCPGASEVLRILHEGCGPEAFLYRDPQGKSYSSAFDEAASGNQIEAMKWMLESGAVEKLDYALLGDENNPPKIRFGAAIAAAEGGAFDALEFLADKVPQLKTLPVEGHKSPMMRLKVKHRTKPRDVHAASYLDLMVIAIAMAKEAGRDVSALVQRFARQLPPSEKISRYSMRLAVEMGVAESVEVMLKAGARMDPEGLGKALIESRNPVGMLRAINRNVEESGKEFEDVCVRHDGVNVFKYEVYKYDEFKNRAFAGATLPKFMTAMVELHKSSNADWGYNRHHGLEHEKFDPEVLAEEMLRFMKMLVPDAISPALLARAVGYECLPLVRRLLDEGVDPNAFPDCCEEKSDYAPILVSNFAPIHRCRSPEMMRLLHAHGADVNLRGALHPAMNGRSPHEGNLLTVVCSDSTMSQVPEMIKAFAECGGDFGAKLGERTLTYYLSGKSLEVKQIIKSIKTQVAISDSVDAAVDRKGASGPAPRSHAAGPL